jgi:hypothetical protein
MKTNRRISIERPASSVSGLSASETYEIVYSQAKAWIRFSSGLIITTEGSEVASDASLRISYSYKIEKGDVVRLLDDERAYRVEALDELYSPGGRLIGFTGFLVRDESLES